MPIPPPIRQRLAALALSGTMVLAGCSADRSPSRDSPAASSPFVTRVLADSTFGWATTDRDGMRIHAARDSYAARNLDAIAGSAAAARAEILARLEERDMAHGSDLHLFLLADREDLRPIVGQRARGWTEPDENAILVVAAEGAPPPLRHEFGHLFSHRRWGRPASYWLSEGVAVFAVGHCAGRSLHDWAVVAGAQGDSLDLASLEPFDFSRAAPHLIAGSFVQHVAEQHGIAAVRALWKDGMSVAQPATGMSAPALEASWRKRLRNRPNANARHGMNVAGIVRCET